MFFASLHSSDVVRMQIGFFRQDLLREPGSLPFLTDGRAQNNAIIGSWCHKSTAHQTSAFCSTPLNG